MELDLKWGLLEEDGSGAKRPRDPFCVSFNYLSFGISLNHVPIVGFNKSTLGLWDLRIYFMKIYQVWILKCRKKTEGIANIKNGKYDSK